MPRLIAESLALLLLVATLGSAVVRPRGLPEAVVAVPAAALLLVLGALPLAQAKAEAKSLAPTIGFLAAVLVLADLCERYGLFDAAGRWIAAGSRGRPVALLGLVFAVASLVTAVLSLDATVVLLTPVVFATVARVRLRAKPYVYACTHLANSASLLLPVSNLTNLLTFRASGLSFARFGAMMALPWAAAIAVKWVVLRRFFSADLVGHGDLPIETPTRVPVFALVAGRRNLAGLRRCGCRDHPPRSGGHPTSRDSIRRCRGGGGSLIRLAGSCSHQAAAGPRDGRRRGGCGVGVARGRSVEARP